MKKILLCLALFAAQLLSPAVHAQPANTGGYEALAKPWQLGFQPPATPVMEQLYNMHYYLLILITVICVFVLALMVYICLRFRRKAHPVPSTTTHNTTLEIIWTAIPILILVAIAIPSLRLHYYMQRPVNPEMTIKVTGYQWYWHYDYPDNGGFGFDSYMKKGPDLKPGDHRQLAVDNRLVVPVDTTIRVLLTGADVIHSWAVPSFGVKKDAVPGRLNETWFKVNKVGTYYGQCSQLCGVGHGFMPIVVEAVSKDDFATWVKKQQPASAAPAAAEAKPVVILKPVKKAPAPKPETTDDENDNSDDSKEKGQEP